MAKDIKTDDLKIDIKDEILMKAEDIIAKAEVDAKDSPAADIETASEPDSDWIMKEDSDFTASGSVEHAASIYGETVSSAPLGSDLGASEKGTTSPTEGFTIEDRGYFDFSSLDKVETSLPFSKAESSTDARPTAKVDTSKETTTDKSDHDAAKAHLDIPKADHTDIVHNAEKVVGNGKDEVITGDDGSDVISAKKGDDDVSGAGGDDWLRGGHGNDVLDGGAGSDILDGEKGDDTLKFTMGEAGDTYDFYDGGKGVDTLEISLTAEQYSEYKDELQTLTDWVTDHANPNNSTGHGFGDLSSHSEKHPIFETSFGLVVRNVENVKINIIDSSPEPEPSPSDTSVVVDLSAEVVDAKPIPDPVITPTSTDAPISVETISATLGADSKITVSVDVEVKALPPQFDVFLVQDLSGSFYNDLPNIKEQFPSLYETMSADYDVAFGVGSFVDKPYKTFGSTTDYVYKTDLAITTDGAVVADAMNSLKILSGYDAPEAQLEALAQAALRSDEIGFRDGSQKFVVLSTDATFHKAGDYVDAVANDLDTEIENEDYPDPADVGALLKAAGITPIFAVTSNVLTYYQDLVNDWGFGEVVPLTSDSSNLASAITNGITSAVQNLSINVVGDEFGYVSSIGPESYEDVGPGTYTFDLTLEIPKDGAAYAADSFELEIVGYGKINVEVDIASVDATGDAYDDTLLGNSEVNELNGMDGNDVLDGRDGNDILNGGTGNDFLTGGAGNDLFVFADGDGADQISDFEAGDVLDLRRVTSVSSFADVMAAAEQVDTDTVIDFGDGDSIKLIGVELSTLHADDVLI